MTIPDDVMKAARLLANSLREPICGHNYMPNAELIARAIQEAVEAERERCLRVIADEIAWQQAEQRRDRDASDTLQAYAAGEAIIALCDVRSAILNPPASKGASHDQA